MASSHLLPAENHGARLHGSIGLLAAQEAIDADEGRQAHVRVDFGPPSKSAPAGQQGSIAASWALPGLQRQMRRLQLFLAASSTLNLVVLLAGMPDVGFTLLLSFTAASVLSLFAVVPRLAVPALASGAVELTLSRRVYRCCAIVATCDFMTLAWWGVVLVFMLQEDTSDEAAGGRDALPLLVAAGCALLGLHAGLAMRVAQDAARAVQWLDATGTMVGWWTWLALGLALALALLVTGCVAAFLLLVMGASDCITPILSASALFR